MDITAQGHMMLDTDGVAFEALALYISRSKIGCFGFVILQDLSLFTIYRGMKQTDMRLPAVNKSFSKESIDDSGTRSDG